MKFNVRLTSNARKDIRNAIDWEDKRESGLGDYFFQDLSEALDALANAPFKGTIRYDKVRCIGTNKFSYLVHYIIDETKKMFMF